MGARTARMLEAKTSSPASPLALYSPKARNGKKKIIKRAKGKISNTIAQKYYNIFKKTARRVP